MQRSPQIGQRGQSLVQVLISIGLMGTMMLIFVSIMTAQQREMAALSQKLASTDLERLLISSLSDGSVCQYITNNPTVLTFDSTAVSPTTPQIVTPTLPIYASVQMPGPVLGPVAAEIGKSASVYSTSAVVKTITLSVSGAPAPLPPAGPGAKFIGNWVVTLDPALLVRSLKPITVATTLTVDTTSPTVAKITSCQGLGGGGIDMAMWGSGKRCKNDKPAYICSNNPGMDWNYNVCIGLGHLASFGEEIRWHAGGQGYAIVFTSCPSGSICPAWGVNPYKTDVACLQGFE